MVKGSRATAKAKTNGARFVCTTVSPISSTLVLASGRARASSVAAGVGAMSGVLSLRRLAGEAAFASLEERFFETRFAAARICLDSFSSVKMDCRV